jgi:hypothetical protein
LGISGADMVTAGYLVGDEYLQGNRELWERKIVKAGRKELGPGA